MDQLLDSLLSALNPVSLPDSLDTLRTEATRLELPHVRQNRRVAVMENVVAHAPPPSAQAQRENPTDGEAKGELSTHPYRIHNYSNLTSIDAFEAENPYKPSLVPIKSDKTLRTGEHAWKFHALCQTRGIAPVFSYDEVAKGCFTVKVQIEDKFIEDLTYFPSKKEAKEAICKRAISNVPTPEPNKGKKRKSSGLQDVSMQDDVTSRRDSSVSSVDSEDWISILNLYTQQQHLPLPEYAEMRTTEKPERFVVTVNVEEGPLTPFGAQAMPETTKKMAKKNAAREAVLWLRHHGKLPETPSPKRRKSVATSAAGPESTGLTQSVNGIELSVSDTRTTPQKLHEMCHRLGLQNPRFEIWPAAENPDPTLPTDSAFVTMVAYFNDVDVQVEPRLGGPIGLVDRVFGKKQAKEMCSQAVLRVLESIRQSRIA